MGLKSLLAGLVFGAILIPAAARAENGYVTQYGALRAGPSADYPQLVILDRGNPLQIYGCLSGWNWCDVSFRGYRGWMRADKIAYYYGGRWMPVPSYGPQIGIPILNFSFDYWDEHYRSRPFYRERDYYVRRHPEYRGLNRGWDPRQGVHDYDHDRGHWRGRDDHDRDHDRWQGRNDRDHDRDRWQGRNDRDHDRDRWQGRNDNDRGHRDHNARPAVASPRPEAHPGRSHEARPGPARAAGDHGRGGGDRGHGGGDRGHGGGDRGHGGGDRGHGGGDHRAGSYPSGPPVAKH